MENETNQDKQSSRSPSEIPFTDRSALAQYVTDTGKILPRRITQLSAKEQRQVTRMIKRARNALLMK
jgi:small subunit ribosomal protein S18